MSFLFQKSSFSFSFYDYILLALEIFVGLGSSLLYFIIKLNLLFIKTDYCFKTKKKFIKVDRK